MLKPVGPMSNTERQRKFRQSHPGYFRKYYAPKRAARKRADREIRAMLLAQAKAEAEAAAAASPATHPLLMLPAPVEVPVIPGLNAIAITPAPAPLPVAQPAKIAA